MAVSVEPCILVSQRLKNNNDKFYEWIWREAQNLNVIFMVHEWKVWYLVNTSIFLLFLDKLTWYLEHEVGLLG